jgi:small subunit ribosomal protein S17
MAKRLIGTIVSDKMQKNVIVSVEVDTKHSIYSKTLKNTKRFKARNTIEAKVGEVVTIQECRPFAKDVNWVVVSKVEEK